MGRLLELPPGSVGLPWEERLDVVQLQGLCQQVWARPASRDRKSTRLNSSHSLHDALPIYGSAAGTSTRFSGVAVGRTVGRGSASGVVSASMGSSSISRSEEHTSELQSFPTRRSSDLWVGCWNFHPVQWGCRGKNGWTWFSFRGCVSKYGLVQHLEIGRAHV